jgi:hypothetical protein
VSARRLLFVTAFVGLPALASAQRRPTSGSSGGGYGGSKAVGQSKVDGPTIQKDMFSTRDLQKENMVAFLLDKKKDLKLSDDEVNALKEINEQLKDTLRGPMKSLDSISSQMRRTDGGSPDQDDRSAARVFGRSYVAEVRADYDTFLKLALGKLSEEHRTSASPLIETRRKELAPPPDKSDR